MNPQKRRSAWWQLWLLFPVLAILAFAEARASLSAAGHRLVETGIVLVVFGLVSVWLRANEVAMLRETRDQFELREVPQPAGLPLQPGAIAGGNGNGHNPGLGIPGREYETDTIHGDRETER